MGIARPIHRIGILGSGNIFGSCGLGVLDVVRLDSACARPVEVTQWP